MNKEILPYEEQINREIQKTPREYWPNLLQIIRIFRESVTLKTAPASFRQSWSEAMEGEVKPITELWRGIDAE